MMAGGHIVPAGWTTGRIAIHLRAAMGAPEYAGIVGFRMIFGVAFVLEFPVIGVGIEGLFHRNWYVTTKGLEGSLV